MSTDHVPTGFGDARRENRSRQPPRAHGRSTDPWDPDTPVDPDDLELEITVDESAAERARRIVDEVLRNDPAFASLRVSPPDGRVPRRPADDADPGTWARHIVAEVLARSEAASDGASTTSSDTGTATAPTPDAPGGRADVGPPPRDAVVDDPRRVPRNLPAYHAYLGGDRPLVLLPGRTVATDGAAWVPDLGRWVRPRRALDRALAPLLLQEGTGVVLGDPSTDSSEQASALPSASDDTGDSGPGQAAVVRWVLVGLVWILAVAVLLPFLLRGISASFDADLDVFGDVDIPAEQPDPAPGDDAEDEAGVEAEGNGAGAPTGADGGVIDLFRG